MKLTRQYLRKLIREEYEQMEAADMNPLGRMKMLFNFLTKRLYLDNYYKLQITNEGKTIRAYNYSINSDFDAGLYFLEIKLDKDKVKVNAGSELNEIKAKTEEFSVDDINGILAFCQKQLNVG